MFQMNDTLFLIYPLLKFDLSLININGVKQH